LSDIAILNVDFGTLTCPVCIDHQRFIATSYIQKVLKSLF